VRAHGYVHLSVRINNGTACNVVTGLADVTETCNGIDDNCNGIVDDIAATSCTLGGCSTGELRCPLTTAGTTVAAACVRTGYLAAGSTCRPAVPGGCDVAEVCPGLTDACPPDAVVRGGHGVPSGGGGRLRRGRDLQRRQRVPGGRVPAAVGDGVPRVDLDRGLRPGGELHRAPSAMCPPDVITRAPTTETCNGVDDNCNGVRCCPAAPR
jgi:hypothetical protein